MADLTIDETEQEAGRGDADDDGGGDLDHNDNDDHQQWDDDHDPFQEVEEDEQEGSDRESTSGNEDQATTVPFIPLSEATSQVGINLATATFYKELVVKERLSVRVANKILRFFQRFSAKDVSRGV